MPVDFLGLKVNVMVRGQKSRSKVVSAVGGTPSEGNSSFINLMDTRYSSAGITRVDGLNNVGTVIRWFRRIHYFTYPIHYHPLYQEPILNATADS